MPVTFTPHTPHFGQLFQSPRYLNAEETARLQEYLGKQNASPSQGRSHARENRPSPLLLTASASAPHEDTFSRELVPFANPVQKQQKSKQSQPTTALQEIVMLEHTSYPQRVVIVTGDDLNDNTFLTAQSNLQELKLASLQGDKEAHTIQSAMRAAISTLYKKAVPLPPSILSVTKSAKPKIERDVFILNEDY